MSPTPIGAERGVALLHVVLLLSLITAAAGGAATLARIEVRISDFHRGGHDAAYGAQAALAVTLRELDRTPDWDAVLAGITRAGFADGPLASVHQIPGGGTVTVCCAAGSMTARARADSGVAWEPYGWQSLSGLLNVPEAPRQYVAAWVADDPDDRDGNAAADSNDRLAVRAESISPLGMRKAIVVLAERAAVDPLTGTRAPGLRILTWHEGR